jgi:Ran-binding protein 9/10
MANTLPPGSTGAPLPGSSSYSTVPSPGSIHRRSSYASVVSGTANVYMANAQNAYQAPVRAGTFSQLQGQSSQTMPRGGPNQQEYLQYRQSPADFSRQAGRSSAQDIEMGNASGGYTGSGHMGGIGRGGIDIGQQASTSGVPPFFVPSYLQNSRYMELLADSYRAKVAAENLAQRSGHSSHPGSLSASSSSSNLHKLAPSHRGMTYDIIENTPAPEENGPAPLPSRWNEMDKVGGIEIQGDGSEVRFVGPTKSVENEAAAVRADHPMPPQCGIFYFEVTVISRGVAKEGFVITFLKLA